MTAAEDSGKPRDPVEAALAEYAEAWQAGNRLDPDEYCENHPECGPKLRAEIDDFISRSTCRTSSSSWRRFWVSRTRRSLTLAPASSITSIALSGWKRSVHCIR